MPTNSTVRRGAPISRYALLVVLAGPVLASCGDSRSGTPENGRTAARGTVRDSSSGIIAPAATPYREVALANPGTVSGTVVIDGDVPRDSTVQLSADQAVCGARLQDPSLVHSGSALGNAVVWVTGLRNGKPMPVDRRFDLTTDHCQYDPHVQAVVTGSTINVHNDDDTPAITKMVRLGGGDTLATVRLIDDGGVVPSDKVAQTPGIVELKSVEHPWSDGYVAIFDQPYFAVTAANGTFRIDSLPPGHYKLMAWHERGGAPVTQEFDVQPGSETKLQLKIRIR